MNVVRTNIMPLNRIDLAGFTCFLAVARHLNFRRAALEMGVTASALSHAITALEARRGVRLLNRTTRSVTLTAAGEALYATLVGPFEALLQASETLNRFRDAPMGRIRLNVPGDAATLLLAPVMPVFVERYPDIEVEISVNNHLIDVIGSGFDAGIRYGGTVPEDMIALRLSPDINWISAASPAYLAHFGAPQTPTDLQKHRCINIRLGNEQLYQWEFERNDQSLAITTPGPLTIDESHASISLALGGVGIIYGAEPILRPHLQQGTLLPVLGGWASTGPGFHIYYSGRRQVPTGLRLLIDLIREIQPLRT